MLELSSFLVSRSLLSKAAEPSASFLEELQFFNSSIFQFFNTFTTFVPFLIMYEPFFGAFFSWRPLMSK